MNAFVLISALVFVSSVECGMDDLTGTASITSENSYVNDAFIEDYYPLGHDTLLPNNNNAATVSQYWFAECENRLNKQINHELVASQIYLSMATYLGRWDVALPGFEKMFKKMSVEEREHGTKIIDFMLKRGGKPVIPIILDLKDFKQQIETNNWSNITNILKTALKLERFVNSKLVDSVRTCSSVQNFHMEDFIDSTYLTEQVDSMNELGRMITQVNRVGNHFGLYQYDKDLL